MTHMLQSLAGGKLVVALEVLLLGFLPQAPNPNFCLIVQGGYNVNSISTSATAVTRVLLGESPPELKPLVANEAATETVWLVAKQQSKYWKSIDVGALEAPEGINTTVHQSEGKFNPFRDFYSEFPGQTLSIPGAALFPIIKLATAYSPKIFRSHDLCRTAQVT